MLREKELILLENLKKDNEKKTEEIRQLRNNQLIGQVSGEETATITDGALAFANILEETEIEVEGEKKKAYIVGLPQGVSQQEVRDSFIVEVDNSYSYKKVKKLYLKKLYNIKKITFFEFKHNSIFDENRGFYQIRLLDCKINIGSDESKKYYKTNYLKVVNNNGAQQTFNTYEEGFWKENNTAYGYFILPFTTLADANNWFQELNTQGNPLKILYPLEEPKLIDLTDDYPELVKDVEYLINNFKTFKEVTHVEVDNGYIDLEYVKSTELALKNIQQQIDNISALMLEGGTGNA